MQITIAIPDNLPLTEADVRLELAIVLYQQHSLRLDQAAQLAVISVDDFYQLLIDRNIVTPPADIDDEPAELVLASLRTSLQQIKEGKLHPISELELVFSDEFKTRLRTLIKRYRSIRTDMKPLLDELQSGNFIGDQIPGTGYTVFKVRLKNSDIQKGKSGSYRVIYQLSGDTYILLVVIYSKSDQDDIPANQIRDIIDGV